MTVLISETVIITEVVVFEWELFYTEATLKFQFKKQTQFLSYQGQGKNYRSSCSKD